MIMPAKARLAMVAFARLDRMPMPITGSALPQKQQMKKADTASTRRFAGAIWFTACRPPRRPSAAAAPQTAVAATMSVIEA